MANPVTSNNRYVALTVLLEALGTAKTRGTVSPVNGTIVELRSYLDVAVDGDNVITAAIDGTAITGASMTHPSSGSAAGEKKACFPTGANTVKAGQSIQCLTDGGGATGQAHITILIEQS